MSTQNDQDKSHEPSQKKLQDAQKKGDIARSSEANSAVAFIAVTSFWSIAGVWAFDHVGASLMAFLSPNTLTFSSDADDRLVYVMATIALGLVFPLGTVIVAVTAMKSWTFAPEKIAWKLNRISMTENAKQKFGPNGLAEFGKNFVKIVVVLTVAVGVGSHLSLKVINLSAVSLPFSATAMVTHLGDLLWAVAAVLCIFALIDIFWQKHKFFQKMRMSHQEIRDEHKEAEGDPHLKQARRQKGIQFASQSMRKDVESADVIIVNPTHFAVALSWDRNAHTAPKCVAKGVDHIAKTIRDIASEHQVPIHSDPPTARAVYATTEIGQQIDPAHYAAVATAIRFADSLKAKKRHEPN